MKIQTINTVPNAVIKGIKSDNWSAVFGTQPIENGWVRYGINDDAAAILYELYKASNIHSTALNFISNIINNSVFEITDENGKDIEISENLQKGFLKWKKGAAKNLAIGGFCGAIVQYAVKDGKRIYTISPQDATQVRIDTNTNIDSETPDLLFSDTFIGRSISNIINISKFLSQSESDRRRKVKVVKLPNIENEASVKELYRGYICQIDNTDIYSTPLYFSYTVLNAVLAEVEMGGGVSNATQRGMTAGGDLVAYLDETTEKHCIGGETIAQAKERIEQDLTSDIQDAMIGGKATGNVLLSFIKPEFNNNGEQVIRKSFQYAPFDNPFDATRFDTYQKWASDNIYLAHSLNPILLAVQPQGGGISNDKNKQILSALKMLLFSIETICTEICVLPKIILSENGFENANVKVQINSILNETLTENMLYQLQTDDVLRDMFGLQPMDDSQKAEIKEKTAAQNLKIQNQKM